MNSQATSASPSPATRKDSSISQSHSNHATIGSASLGKDWEIVPILNGFAPERRLAQLPCFMMETPVRNRDFYGRQDALLQLDQHLLIPSAEADFSREPQSPRHVAICGIGGVGKTSIAIEYAFSRRDMFDAIFWIRADEPAKLEQGNYRDGSFISLVADSTSWIQISGT